MSVHGKSRQHLDHVVALFVFATLILVSLTAGSTETETLGWEDLVAQVDFEDPFLALDQNQLSALRRYSEIMSSDKEKEQQESKKIEQQLAEQGISDIKNLLSKRHKIADLRRRKATEVNGNLNGVNVRLAGYMLPLEFDEHTVSEFLLVPWVGACIHVPPPPPNQMIHVVMDKAVEFNGLYEPVWLSGTLKTQSSKQDLFLVDGSSVLDIGYTMKNGSVQKYR
jgi:hypothetical protein